MKTIQSQRVPLFLTAALLSGISTLTFTARAQTNPYAKWKKVTPTPKPAPKKAPAPLSRAYVPTRGSSVRQAIADAMRRDVGKFAGVYVIFTFKHIKAHGDWAYAVGSPSSPNGKNRYEMVTALLKRQGNTWNVVDRIAGGGDASPALEMKKLKDRNPKAPSDIFPL